MTDASKLQIALPKGRMQDGILTLLSDAGIQISTFSRGYRPTINIAGVEVKLLKPQNIVEMLHAGSRDLAFAGKDWVVEKGADLVELLDTELDPVRIVAAAPRAIADTLTEPRKQPLIIASEYETLTRNWIAHRNLNAQFVRSYGATEVFPPEDADLIVDNTATGATLKANGLHIIDELMQSSTRLYANPRALENPAKKATIDTILLLLKSALAARKRVILELNCDESSLPSLVAAMPCMRHPTVSRLSGDAGFAVKSAVLKSELPTLIPKLRALGGSDIIISQISQIIAD